MKHSKVRQTIVETASELFYSKGYNLTGINEIIKEAGIAKATLYSHFSSKEEICLAYLEYKDETFLGNLTEYLDTNEKGKNKILGLFDFLKQFFRDQDFNGCWCINTISEIPKENKKIRITIQQQKNSFIGLISTLIEENLSVMNGEPERSNLAKKIYILYESAIAESHLHREVWPI
ncbi:MAG: TetR/AcrR family transcriptional regulator, partial [Bacteroidota bacterium]